ncbi:riboflavin synthase [Rubrobacter taiwanensis]|jgi:riboflavin synthase|uniref:Riboflavin synthase n=1 Tax=Rubrobacter taiwanensis TaxID=185139 RepID=A0A4R1BHG1_9ACTN|nr:riboflavin synthase [Rubrobacter taiwanensis]TCJ16669.1 riboflavin synthase [Rubrobacter taiwanensis]
MFTGIVEEAGRIVELDRDERLARLVVRSEVVFEDAKVGDSICVSGVCLTVNRREGRNLTFYAMPETLRRTALKRLEVGRAVNLERAMTPQSRFGGHIVQGHVDGVGEVVRVSPEGEAGIWEFSAPESVLRYTVEKGSICVEGISLTVVSVNEVTFTVSILPQTEQATNLGELEVGDPVNLEADVIGKYVERLLEPRLPGRRSVEDAV